MNINDVKTQELVKVGSIQERTDHDRKLKFVPDVNISKDTLKKNVGRVYLIVVDSKIVKIGGSQAKGGIKSTISSYLAGFSKGMSPRTYCGWNYLRQCVKAGKTVEFYAVFAPMATVTIPTMTGSKEVEIPVDFHQIELSFVEHYISVKGEYPYLNIQESGRKWIDTGLLEGYPGIIEV